MEARAGDLFEMVAKGGHATEVPLSGVSQEVAGGGGTHTDRRVREQQAKRPWGASECPRPGWLEQSVGRRKRKEMRPRRRALGTDGGVLRCAWRFGCCYECGGSHGWSGWWHHAVRWEGEAAFSQQTNKTG